MSSELCRRTAHREDDLGKGRGRHVLLNQRQELVVEDLCSLIDAPVHLPHTTQFLLCVPPLDSHVDPSLVSHLMIIVAT